SGTTRAQTEHELITPCSNTSGGFALMDRRQSTSVPQRAKRTELAAEGPGGLLSGTEQAGNLRSAPMHRCTMLLRLSPKRPALPSPARSPEEGGAPEPPAHDREHARAKPREEAQGDLQGGSGRHPGLGVLLPARNRGRPGRGVLRGAP